MLDLNCLGRLCKVYRILDLFLGTKGLRWPRPPLPALGSVLLSQALRSQTQLAKRGLSAREALSPSPVHKSATCLRGAPMRETSLRDCSQTCPFKTVALHCLLAGSHHAFDELGDVQCSASRQLPAPNDLAKGSCRRRFNAWLPVGALCALASADPGEPCCGFEGFSKGFRLPRRSPAMKLCPWIH